MKTGRNDPCPCGSGKKYKKCCLAKAEAEDFPYRRISQVYDNLVERILAFVNKEIDLDLMDEALDAFMLRKGQSGPLVPFDGFSQLFVPWALFSWRIPGKTAAKLQPQADQQKLSKTIAALYFSVKGKKLDSFDQKVLHSCVDAPFSFCEITETTPGKGFICKDLFTGQVREVFERSASEALAKGDIFFCSIAPVDEFEILLGTSPVKFGAAAKVRVLALIESFGAEAGGMKADTLLEHDAAIRALFLELHTEATGAGTPCSSAAQGKNGLQFNEKAMQDPEVRNKIIAVYREQWRQWVDTPLSALKGKTPRQAVQSASGRETVEALLKQAASTQSAQLELQLEGIAQAREDLGLE